MSAEDPKSAVPLVDQSGYLSRSHAAAKIVRIALILSPYYLGHKNLGMGAGPTRLIGAGLVEALGDAGHTVQMVTVELDGQDTHEIGASFAVNRRIAEAVNNAIDDGAFPVVLGGNCNVCLGVIGGIGSQELGVAWFDAHGDFHSPDSTGSGFFDGMPLHIATGNSWSPMAATIPGFKPVKEQFVILAGVRDIDLGEDALLDASLVTVIPFKELTDEENGSFASAAKKLSESVQDLYVHVDLDVLAPEVAPANSYQPSGGLDLDQFRVALNALDGKFRVRAATLACFDPTGDPDGIAAAAGNEIVKMLANLGASG